MALYRGTNKLAGLGKGFNPASSGTNGQYLKKVSGGYDWGDVNEFEPSNEGSVDQVLTKTSGGYEWVTLAAGGLPIEFVEKQTIDKTSDSVAIGPFSYDVFIITDCKSGYSVPGTLEGNTSSMGTTYLPNDSWYQKIMDFGFFPAGTNIVYYNGRHSNTTLYVRVYKLNLPS